MKKLEYKGYYGSIEFSPEDNCLFGEVLGMPNNLISYEGSNETELFNDFKEAIDFYLDYCQRKNIKPRKSYGGLLNIQIPSEIHLKTAIYAENHGITINDFIRDSIEKRLECV